MNSKPIILIAILFVACVLQSANGQTAPANNNEGQLVYKTIYLTNLTQPSDANEVINSLRNMIPSAKMYYVPSQGAMTVRATPDEVALAERIIADLDKTKKLYRLTYTMTDTDGGKTIGVQHFTVVVASGSKTVFKQGSRIPVATGTSGSNDTQITYLDLGEEIEASLDSFLEGVRLRTHIVQSSVAEEKSQIGAYQEPIIRQTTFEGTSTLVQGKSLALGTFDVPGSTRHQQIEVVSELIR